MRFPSIASLAVVSAFGVNGVSSANPIRAMLHCCYSHKTPVIVVPGAMVSAAPTPAMGTGLSFGSVSTFGTGLTFGAAPSFGTGLTFGATPTFGTGLTFGAIPTVNSGLTFGAVPMANSGLTFGATNSDQQFGAGGFQSNSPFFNKKDNTTSTTTTSNPCSKSAVTPESIDAKLDAVIAKETETQKMLKAMEEKSDKNATAIAGGILELAKAQKATDAKLDKLIKSLTAHQTKATADLNAAMEKLEAIKAKTDRIP